MGRFLDFVFNRFFLGMIATGFFWILTLAGGIILGLAPASATLMSLCAEHGYSFREYSLKEAWSLYKQNFVSSNLVFYSFLGVDLVLIYGLYLLVQLPHQTIIHLIATFLNVLVVADQCLIMILKIWLRNHQDAKVPLFGQLKKVN